MISILYNVVGFKYAPGLIPFFDVAHYGAAGLFVVLILIKVSNGISE